MSVPLCCTIDKVRLRQSTYMPLVLISLFAMPFHCLEIEILLAGCSRPQLRAFRLPRGRVPPATGKMSGVRLEKSVLSLLDSDRNIQVQLCSCKPHAINKCGALTTLPPIRSLRLVNWEENIARDFQIEKRSLRLAAIRRWIGNHLDASVVDFPNLVIASGFLHTQACHLAGVALAVNGFASVLSVQHSVGAPGWRALRPS